MAPSANTMSPSKEEPAGVMRWKSAAPDARANCESWMRSSAALVATTASVVFRSRCSAAIAASRCGSSWSMWVASRKRPSAPRAPATMRPWPSRTSPNALTTATAATHTPADPRSAQPTPPFIARPMPAALPTVAPVPAPTLPSETAVGEAVSVAAYAMAGVGRPSKRPSGPRSKMTAAGTIGTTPLPIGNPRPRSSIQRITPAAASSP